MKEHEMNKFFRATILLSSAVFVVGCANPLHQATSIRYGDQCNEAQKTGRLDVAEQACYRALVNVDWGHLGDDQKSMRMYNLARVKRALGKFDEAEKLYIDSLGIEEKQPRPSSEKIGRRLAELAMVYGQKDEFQNGLPYVERLYQLADMYQGYEKKSVALVFYAYSQELQKKQTTELSKKLAAKAHEMGFDPKEFGK
jgi:tetratricopeptide (TPR) repeat protein